MHFGIHVPTDNSFVARDPPDELPDLDLRADLRQSSAKIIHRYARRNSFDTELFSHVTGVYEPPREELSESEAANAAYPHKVLDSDTLHDLHSFIEDILADVEQRYDIRVLEKRHRNAASDVTPARLFDSDTSEAYQTYHLLDNVRKLTSAAIEHDVQLYYGESDPSKW